VIEYPDSAGVACQVNQHKIYDPTVGFSGGLPNFPNFRLGPVDPPCELVSTLDIPSLISFEVYPNPVDKVMRLSVEPGYGKWIYEIYNAQGQLVDQDQIRDEITEVSTEWYPAGLYVVHIRSENGQVSSRKVLVGH